MQVRATTLTPKNKNTLKTRLLCKQIKNSLKAFNKNVVEKLTKFISQTKGKKFSSRLKLLPSLHDTSLCLSTHNRHRRETGGRQNYRQTHRHFAINFSTETPRGAVHKVRHARGGGSEKV